MKSFIDYTDAFACSKSSRPASSETPLSSPTLFGSSVSSSTSGSDLKPSWKRRQFCVDNSILSISELVLADPRCFDYPISFLKMKKVAHRQTVLFLHWNRSPKNVLHLTIDFLTKKNPRTWGGGHLLLSLLCRVSALRLRLLTARFVCWIWIPKLGFVVSKR